MGGVPWPAPGGAEFLGEFRTSRCLRAGFGRSDGCRATFGCFHPFERPNLARRCSSCPNHAREHGWVSESRPTTPRCLELARRRAGLGRSRSEKERAREGTRLRKSAPSREPSRARTLSGVGRARRSLASSGPAPSPVITERLPTDRVRPSQLAV